MNKLLLLSLLAFAPVTMANADLKVAVIDLGKAFDSYYKTKDASAKIDAKKAAYTKDIQDMVADFQTMQNDSGAFGHKAPRHEFANAGATARDEDDLVLKSHDLCWLGK